LVSAISDRILQNYPSVAKDLARPLLEFLRIARESCGDSDQALVLFAIAARTYEHADFRRIRLDRLTSGRGDPPPSLGTNVRSLAESLGIPRETVRRRVQELAEAGLVVRDAHDVRLTARGLSHLTPAREALANVAARCFQIVSCLDEAPVPAAAPPARVEICNRPA
jgi:DNA-binding MarR family transcriptional regulator